MRESWRCPHCRSKEPRAACVKCNREMCVDCISHWPTLGRVCGLCYDRAQSQVRWNEYKSRGGVLSFDEWYDKHA